MHPIRSATLSRRILRSRRRAIFATWEETGTRPVSFHNEAHVRQFCKVPGQSKSWIQELGPTVPTGSGLFCVTWNIRARNSLISARTFLSSASGKSGKDSKVASNEIDDWLENILLLLKDKKTHPIGSISLKKLKEAEDALEHWVSVSATTPRPRKRIHNNCHDRHTEEYRKCFENAKSILSRLVLEQNFHDYSYITESDEIFVTLDRKAVNNGLVDTGFEKNDGRHNEEKEQQNEHNKVLSEDLYFVRSFLLNRVVDCWRIGWRDGRLDFTPNEMIAWVEDMDNSGSDSIISDNRTLTMIVDGFCLRGDPYEAPLLAQWLLDRRLGQAQEDEDDITLRPDTIFFTNVIRSWARSGRIEAPEMTDGLLQMMNELCSNIGWIESAPNAFSYAATMEAWSKSQRHPDSIKRIEALLEEMKNSNLIQVVPDRLCYQYVLNAWANSKSAIGAEKAFDVLQEMIALHEAGNVLVTPNASNFSRVIRALAQNGKDERLKVVLEQLQDMYSTTEDKSQPIDECWKAYILAKAKTGGVAEAQDMLDELVERAISKGNRHLMPRRSYFIDTLVAWTKVKDQVLAAKMSHKVLDRMIDLAQQDASYRNLQPDAKTYEKVILAWSRSRHHSAPEYIDALLREMERQSDSGDHKMKPRLPGYTNLMLAWQRSGRIESADAIQKIFDSLQSRSSNTIGEKHLRPDKYVFGILIDSWARRKNIDKVEFIFEEMMKEWKNGNSDARPDIHIFHKVLQAHSEGNKNRANAIEKCDYYLSLMKEVGVPSTILAYSYFIYALSSNRLAGSKDIVRASAVLDELLESVREGTISSPPKYREYRQFLLTISKSCIPRRNQQAKKVLKSLPRTGGAIPKELLPP